MHYARRYNLIQKGNDMAVDHPHSGGEDYEKLLKKLKEASLEYWPAIERKASIIGDERSGGIFYLFNPEGIPIDWWKAGDLWSEEKLLTFHNNAKNKCLVMHAQGLVCSGIAANPGAVPPIYDGGIRLENGCFLAFSGLRAELDRVYCMLVAEKVKVLDDLLFNTIMTLGPNESLVRAMYIETGLCYLSMAMKDVMKS